MKMLLNNNLPVTLDKFKVSCILLSIMYHFKQIYTFPVFLLILLSKVQ